MTATLPSADRAKLVKALALLESDKPGEVQAAAAAAVRIIQGAGITWADLLKQAPAKREPLHSVWRATCAELAKRPGELRPWERAFIADLPGFQRISTRQRYVLSEIARRVLSEGGGE